MTRDEYHALRRAAHAASVAYCRQAGRDGRSSYASHSIACDHALREACEAGARVPRNHPEPLETIQRRNRRRRVLECIRDRNWARERAPCCLAAYERKLRAALYHVEVRHV